MARRVGFGGDDNDPDKSKMTVADQAMERFRKRSRIQAAKEKREAEQNRGKFKKVTFLFFWLVLWIGMAGFMILSIASDGLGTNVIGLVVVVAATVFVTSKVISRIIATMRGTSQPHDREENF